MPHLITWISKNPHLPGDPDPYPNQAYHKTLVWLLHGRAIAGSIEEDNDGRLTFKGKFSTSKHPDGTDVPDNEEQGELKALLDREKPDVDKADREQYEKTRENYRRDLERAKRQAKHRKEGTCEVIISGPDSIAKGKLGHYTADGLPGGGIYSWAPGVQEDLGGLYGVQQAKGETTLRADEDDGGAGVGVIYKVGTCEAKASRVVHFTK